MLDELQHQRLTVALTPAQRGSGSVRTVMEPNPEWYQRFCARYQAGRRRDKRAFDTGVKRQMTERALKRIISGEVHTARHMNAGKSGYIARLIPEIREYMRRGDQERKEQRAAMVSLALSAIPF
jgi:hypothetical protein